MVSFYAYVLADRKRNMIKRITATLIGISLLILVYYLGVKSVQDTNYVLWFGLASAIAAPIGLGLIGYSIKRQDVLSELAKVPEIEKLTKEAKSQEEKIALLAKERANLAEIIKLESRRQALINRKELLENDGARIFEEIRLVEQEMKQLQITTEESIVTKELKMLHERIKAKEKGNIIIRIGSREFTLDRRFTYSFPFPLDLILTEGIRVIGNLSVKISAPKKS